MITEIVMVGGGLFLGGLLVSWRVRQNVFLHVSDVDPGYALMQQKFLLEVGDRMREHPEWLKVFRHQRRLVRSLGVPRGAMRRDSIEMEEMPPALPAPDGPKNILGRDSGGKFASKVDLDAWQNSRGYQVTMGDYKGE